MVLEVGIPKYGLMKEAQVIKWHKKERDTVKEGELLLVIETEKVSVNIDSPGSGILQKILVSEGSYARVGQTIALIAEPGEEVSENAISAAVAKSPITAPKPLLEDETEKPSVPRAKKIKASPLARKLAEEHNIDLNQIEGTDPDGRIVKEDIVKVIEAARTASPVAPPVVAPTEEVGRVLELSQTRKIIGRRMLTSLQNAPQLTICTEFDMTEMVKLRQQILDETEKTSDLRVTFTDILVKSVAEALKEFPRVNARVLEGGKLVLLDEINIGVATATEHGLLVPVVHNADKKMLLEVASEVSVLVEKARQGKLSIQEITGGTFTISNMGMYDIDVFTPIVNPPECAILGVGRIMEKPVIVNGQICIKPMSIMSLTLDHRIIDGVDGAVFLRRLRNFVEKPADFLK